MSNEVSEQTVKSAWGIFSFLGSILIHLAILVIVYFVWQWTSSPGVPWGGRTADSVGIVFSTPKGYEQPSAGSAGGTNNVKSEEQNALAESSAQNSLESFLPVDDVIGMSQGKSDQGQSGGASANGSEDQAGGGNGDGQSVGFSDVRGRGKKFVYVLDRSESMKWSNQLPMKYAVQEAKASISSLDPAKGALKFQLVWFNHHAENFEDGKLLDVTEQNKNRVCRLLDSLVPVGATDPLEALELAIRIRPDVIFFLTDADEEIPPLTLDRIRESRVRGGVRQIHVVEFGKKTDKVKTSFRRLADENNGQYIFKDLYDLQTKAQ